MSCKLHVNSWGFLPPKFSKLKEQTCPRNTVKWGELSCPEFNHRIPPSWSPVLENSLVNRLPRGATAADEVSPAWLLGHKENKEEGKKEYLQLFLKCLIKHFEVLTVPCIQRCSINVCREKKQWFPSSIWICSASLQFPFLWCRFDLWFSTQTLNSAQLQLNKCGTRDIWKSLLTVIIPNKQLDRFFSFNSQAFGVARSQQSGGTGLWLQ